MSHLLQYQANIVHGIMGEWTMSFEIVNTLLLEEAPSPMMTMESG